MPERSQRFLCLVNRKRFRQNKCPERTVFDDGLEQWQEVLLCLHFDFVIADAYFDVAGNVERYSMKSAYAA